MAKTDTGFIDPGNKGFAIRKLKRGPDGRVYVVFVDAKTGQEVKDAQSYNIIEQGHQVETDSQTPVDETQNKEEPSLTKKIISGRDGGSDDSMSQQVVNDREMGNNYNYYNSPSALGMAGFLPGPVGLAAKAGGLGIRANNEVATNEARDMLGMKDKGLMSTVKSLIGDQKGYIGDVSYDDPNKSTPVGFEALDKQGRTTLTPNEARNRQQLDPDFKEATPAVMKQSVSSFKKENPNARQGLLSGLFSGARDLFSSILGGDKQSYAFGGDTSKFPDQPNLSVEQRTSNSLNKSNRSPNDFSGSDQLNEAKEKGSVGLW